MRILKRRTGGRGKRGREERGIKPETVFFFCIVKIPLVSFS